MVSESYTHQFANNSLQSKINSMIMIVNYNIENKYILFVFTIYQIYLK